MKPLFSDHLWAIRERGGLCTEVKIGAFGTQPSGLYREVVSVQRSKSIAKELTQPSGLYNYNREVVSV